MAKITTLLLATSLVAPTMALAWEDPAPTQTQPVVHQKPRVEVYYATKVVKQPVTKYVTKTRLVPTQQVRQGVRKVAKTIKVPKVIYVEKTVYEDQPYSYTVTVNKTESYQVPVTSYVEKVVKVPKYRKVVDTHVSYTTTRPCHSCGGAASAHYTAQAVHQPVTHHSAHHVGYSVPTVNLSHDW